MHGPSSYFVCATPHSGGPVLCEALRATGVAGLPRAYFLPAGAPTAPGDVAGFEDSDWARERGIASFPEFLPALMREYRTPNGVFSASLDWTAYEALLEKLRVFTPYGGTARVRPLLRKYFGALRFVWLTRAEQQAQAREWTASEGGPVRASRVEALRRRIETEEATWASLFDLLEVEPLRLVHEEWIRDPAAVVEAVLHWLRGDS